jgi:hypothetical protein
MMGPAKPLFTAGGMNFGSTETPTQSLDAPTESSPFTPTPAGKNQKLDQCRDVEVASAPSIVMRALQLRSRIHNKENCWSGTLNRTRAAMWHRKCSIRTLSVEKTREITPGFSDG